METCGGEPRSYAANRPPRSLAAVAALRPAQPTAGQRPLRRFVRHYCGNDPRRQDRRQRRATRYVFEGRRVARARPLRTTSRHHLRHDCIAARAPPQHDGRTARNASPRLDLRLDGGHVAGHSAFGGDVQRLRLNDLSTARLSHGEQSRPCRKCDAPGESGDAVGRRLSDVVPGCDGHRDMPCAAPQQPLLRALCSPPIRRQARLACVHLARRPTLRAAAGDVLLRQCALLFPSG